MTDEPPREAGKPLLQGIVRGKPRQERLSHAMSYAFGPDGRHACLILAAAVAWGP